MPKTLYFKPHPLLSKPSFLINPIGEITFSYRQTTNFASKPHVFHSPPLLSNNIHSLKPIICARKNRKGSGYQKLIKVLPKVMTFMASNLKVLPEPLDMLIEEFGVGGGGGGDLGFWKSFGGGNFDGWRRRKGNVNSRFVWFLVFCGLGLVLFLFGGELKTDVCFGVLLLSLFGAVLIKGFRRGVRDWILGLCIFGVLLGLGLKREDRQKWVERYNHRVCSPFLLLMKGKRRHGRSIW